MQQYEGATTLEIADGRADKGSGRFETETFRIESRSDAGLYQAGFAMELTEVIRQLGQFHDRSTGAAPFGGEGPNRHLSTIIEGMSVHQEISFSYTGGRDKDERPFFTMSIKGRGKGTTRESALRECEEAFTSLNVLKATFDHRYYFEPVPTDKFRRKESPKPRWTATLHPYNLSVEKRPSGPVGFLSSQSSIESHISAILNPCLFRKKTPFLSALSASLTAFYTPVTVDISVVPFTLSDSDRTCLDSLGRALRNGRATISAPIPYEQGWQNYSGLENRLLRIIEDWIRTAKGWRIQCIVHSLEPAPKAFLDLVGNEVFHGQFSSASIQDSMVTGPVTDKESAGLVFSLSPSSLFLGDALCNTAFLPPVFPDPSHLGRFGMRKRYPQNYRPTVQKGIVLGHVPGQEKERAVVYPTPDRARHCYILGATGTGKSTLLLNMILQDIRNGEGVTLIDPHGDLYNQVLESIPAHREKDVVLIDPSDFDHPVGINFLECPDSPFRDVQINFIVNEMIKIFDRLYDLKITGGPVFEQYMRNALLLIMDSCVDGATLLDVPKVFEDDTLRDHFTKHCNNRTVVNFWKKQAERAGGEASLSNITPYITSKLNQFTTNSLIGPIIGQKTSTIDFRDIMDKGKIMLVNLSKGLLGEMDTQLLGMLITGKLFSSAMGRIAVPADKRRTMFLYIDEFQNFTTESIIHLLSEARKFGLSLTVANQNLTQLIQAQGKPPILDAVLGNVGTMLFFRMGVVDAVKMETVIRPEMGPDDLQELPDFHVAARILANNIPQRPFVFSTLPAPERNRPSSAAHILAFSRTLYAAPKNTVVGPEAGDNHIVRQ